VKSPAEPPFLLSNLTTRCWFWLGVVVVAGLLAYSSSWQGTFVFDDWGTVAGGPLWDSGAEGWRIALASGRPVTDLSFWLGQQVLGRDPPAVHTVNVAIHLATGCLLLLLIGETWQRPVVAHQFAPAMLTPAEWSQHGWQFAGVIAVLWTVHPLTTQAVTYLVQRYESLSALLVIAALWAYGRASQGHRALVWSFIAAGFATIAIGAKQSGIVAPVLAVLYERTFCVGAWWDRVRQRGLFYVACLPAMLWALQLVIPIDEATPAASLTVVAIDAGDGRGEELYSVMNDSFAGFQYQAVSPWEYLRSQGNVILHYVRLAVVPYPLCFDYGWPVAEQPAEYLPGVLVVGIWLLTALVLWYRGSVWGFLGLAPFVCLGPTSSILPIRDLAVEHRTYLPLMFWLTTFAAVCCVYGSRAGQFRLRQRVVTGVVVSSFLIAMGLTWSRNGDYHSEARLWQTVISTAPLNARAFYNYGHRLIEDGQPVAAVNPLRRSIELAALPRNARFMTPHELGNMHNRLGTAYHAQGDYVAAKTEYQSAIQYDRSIGLPHMNLGNCLALLGELPAAEREYRIAAALLPNDAAVRLAWADLYAEQLRVEEALALYTAALERDPELHAARVNRGTLLAQAGRYAAAARDLQDALRDVPRDSPAARQILRWLTAVETALKQGL